MSEELERMQERKQYLLREAAECFIEMTSPFAGDWLKNHDVTSDECIWLSHTIGTMLASIVAGPPIVRALVALVGVQGVSKDLVDEFLLQYVTDQARKRLQDS